MSIGERIQGARKDRRLTQREAARKASISVNSWRYYEANERSPSLDHLHAVANALSVSVPFLLYGGEEWEAAEDVSQKMDALKKENEYLWGMVAAYEKILGKVMPDAHP